METDARTISVENDDVSFITPPVSTHASFTKSFHSEKTYFGPFFSPEHKRVYLTKYLPIISVE